MRPYHVLLNSVVLLPTSIPSIEEGLKTCLRNETSGPQIKRDSCFLKMLRNIALFSWRLLLAESTCTWTCRLAGHGDRWKKLILILLLICEKSIQVAKDRRNLRLFLNRKFGRIKTVELSRRQWSKSPREVIRVVIRSIHRIAKHLETDPKTIILVTRGAKTRPRWQNVFLVSLQVASSWPLPFH